MSAPIKADPDSYRRSSSSEPEDDIPIDLLDEAKLNFGAGLPPFIQRNLDPTIMPGDKHQVIPKTNNGTIPSIKSTKRVQLVCRAWNNNNSDRFWTYDFRNVRYIVKAFRTHAQPKHMPKIAYHIWEGMGGKNRFQTTQVAFDADDRLYGPDVREKFIPPAFGTIDTNKELRTYAEYLDYMLDWSKRSSTREKGAFNLRMKALSEHDIANDGDERPVRRTRSMKQQNTAYDRIDIPPIPSHPLIPRTNTSGGQNGPKSKEPVKSQGEVKAEGSSESSLVHEDKSNGKYQNKFSGLRARRRERRVLPSMEPSSHSYSNSNLGPEALEKIQQECSSNSESKHRTILKTPSQDRDNETATNISNHSPGYQGKSTTATSRQDKLENVRISDQKSSHHHKSTKLVIRQDKSEADNIGKENSFSKKSLRSTRIRED